MGIVFSGMFALGVVLYVATPTDVHLDHILFGDVARRHLGRRRQERGDRPPGGARRAPRPPRLAAPCLRSGARPRHRPAGRAAPLRPAGAGRADRGGGVAGGGIILAIAVLISPGAIAFLWVRRFGRMLAVAVAVAVGAAVARRLCELLDRLGAGADHRAGADAGLCRQPRPYPARPSPERLTAGGFCGRVPAGSQGRDDVMRWRVLVVAVLGVLAPAESRADAAMDAKIEGLVPDLEAYIAKRHGGLPRPRPRRRHRQPATGWFASKASASRWEGGPAVDADSVFQIGSTTKAFLATTFAIARRPRQPRRGRPRCRPRPRLPAQGPLGHPRVPGLRPDGAALRPAADRQRPARLRRLRRGRDGPLAAPRRADDELPLGLHLHQHHAHPCRTAPRAGRWVRRTGTPLVRDEIFGPLGMTGPR